MLLSFCASHVLISKLVKCQLWEASGCSLALHSWGRHEHRFLRRCLVSALVLLVFLWRTRWLVTLLVSSGPRTVRCASVEDSSSHLHHKEGREGGRKYSAFIDPSKKKKAPSDHLQERLSLEHSWCFWCNTRFQKSQPPYMITISSSLQTIQASATALRDRWRHHVAPKKVLHHSGRGGNLVSGKLPLKLNCNAEKDRKWVLFLLADIFWLVVGLNTSKANKKKKNHPSSLSCLFVYWFLEARFLLSWKLTL